MRKSFRTVTSALGLSVAVMGVLELAIATPARAQSSENVNDVFDSSSNRTEIFGNNGLNINGLIDASRRLEQSYDQPWGLREESVDEEVNRVRTAQDRRFGPEIFQEEQSAAPLEEAPVQPIEESTGVEDETAEEEVLNEAAADPESLDGEASEIAP